MSDHSRRCRRCVPSFCGFLVALTVAGRISAAEAEWLKLQAPSFGVISQLDEEETLAWAEHLVIAQKPAAEFSERIRRSGLPVLDLVGSLATPRGAAVA